MAKDTEKLIRQLSLISFLMAERRPVSALEIKQDVEGYSQMNDEAFARRFYADRAELESLGIHLKVDKPAEGYYEAENYSLPPENFYLPAIEFTDEELGALRMSLSLLDGEFAYAEPLRLALQQLSWGKPSPLDAPEELSVALAVTAGAGGRDLSQRLSKVETAIFRRKTIVFDYYTIGRDAEESRKVDPYHLLYQGGQFYLIGYSHERDDMRVFRVSRIRGKVGYSSKAEHDFNRPEEFDPRDYATRTDWQLGEPIGRARIWLSDRIDWLALRHFGHAGEVTEVDDGVIFETDYANARQMVSWVLGLGEHARVDGPPELVEEWRKPPGAGRRAPHRAAGAGQGGQARRSRRIEEDDDRESSPIRPERFARLVTLAGILIETAREGRKLDVAELCERLQVTEQELRQDIDVLNVVNFGGGSYVLYAEVQGDQIEVDPEPYGDNFARPARLLPLEAKALVAAIDLIGEHLPEGSLSSARAEDRGRARPGPGPGGPADHHRQGRRLGDRPRRQRRDRRAPAARDRALQGGARTSSPSGRIEPYKLMNGQEGWYVARVGSRQGRHALVPARPDPLGHRPRRDLRAAPGHRARHPRLAAHRRGGRRAPRPRLDGARARPLGARGQARGRRAGRRRGDRRAALRGAPLPGARDAQGGRRRRGAGARRRPPGGPRGRRGPGGRRQALAGRWAPSKRQR